MYIWKEIQIMWVASGKSNYIFEAQEWRKTFHGILFGNIEVLDF